MKRRPRRGFARHHGQSDARSVLLAEVQRRAQWKWRGPDHGPKRVGDGHADAMPLWKYPRGEMEGHVEVVYVGGVERSRLTRGIALRAGQSASRHQRHLTARRHILQPHKP